MAESVYEIYVKVKVERGFYDEIDYKVSVEIFCKRRESNLPITTLSKLDKKKIKDGACDILNNDLNGTTMTLD